jgi:hypothetical protein
MWEAYVIETGETLDIKFQNKIMKFTFELPSEIKSEENPTIESWVKFDKEGKIQGGSESLHSMENKKDEPYYILSDGNKYYEKQLIIGLDNIREYKIKNIIE